MIERQVVLPAPLGPTITSVSPGGTSKAAARRSVPTCASASNRSPRSGNGRGSAVAEPAGGGQGQHAEQERHDRDRDGGGKIAFDCGHHCQRQRLGAAGEIPR